MKVPTKTIFLASLADVDEPAGTGEAGSEFAHVQVSVLIGLGQPQESHVQPSAVVKIKLIGLIDEGFHVGAGAEIQAAGRNSSDHAGLGG